MFVQRMQDKRLLLLHVNKSDVAYNLSFINYYHKALFYTFLFLSNCTPWSREQVKQHYLFDNNILKHGKYYSENALIFMLNFWIPLLWFL